MGTFNYDVMFNYMYTNKLLCVPLWISVFLSVSSFYYTEIHRGHTERHREKIR